MEPTDITRYLTETFEDVQLHVHEALDQWFYFHGDARMFPFATILNKDDPYDTFSNLDRPGVYRLNVGVGKATFTALFGSPLAEDAYADVDFTALDTLMPHPVYHKQRWVSVLNPSAATFETLKPLLAEAYAIAKHRPVKPD